MTDHRPMEESLGGGIVGYVQRMRAEHGATYVDRPTERVWSGCRCGAVGCSAPIWLAHIEGLIASYEAKVEDFAAETLRSSSAYAAIQRAVSPILLAARLGDAPMFDGEFFDKGFPPDEREALSTALHDEWQALLRIRLEPGRDASRLHFAEEAT